MLDRTCPGPRRQRADTGNGTELRGLMHDLSHGLATLSYLVDGIRRDPQLPANAGYRVELMDKQLELLLDAVDLRSPEPAPEPIEVRRLLAQFVSLTALSTPAWVTLRPGSPVELCVDRTVLWRMVTNLVGNAVRAAGPGGTVELEAVRTAAGAVIIEIADDGPGFGAGPRGTAAYGLGIVGRLARACGASVRVRSAEGRGARVCLVFGQPGTGHRGM